MEVGGRAGKGACGEPSYARVGTPRARSAAVKHPLPAGGRTHMNVSWMSWTCHGCVMDMHNMWTCRGHVMGVSWACSPSP